MRSSKHCGRLFQWCHIISAKAVLKALRTACGILCIFLGIPSLAKAAPPQVERIRLRPTRELLERSSHELSGLSHSRQREVARRLRGALAGEKNTESKNSLRQLLAETPFYGSEASLLKLSKEYPLGSPHFGHPSLLDWVQENGFEEQVQPEVEKKTVFLEVNKRKGQIAVTARTDVDFWLKGAGLPELSSESTHEVSSLDDVDKIVGDANTVVLQGDDLFESDGLPVKWSDLLGEKRDFLRNSFRSPKKLLREYASAAELLERRAEPGKTRIFDALPQAREDVELKRELKRMRKGTDELPGWREHRERMDALRAETEFPIEPATKEAFLQELRSGTHDTVILIAHSTDGKIHFPDGRTITTSEMSSIYRLMVPARNVIIVSCEAGIVNGPVPSTSEILLGGNAAVNFIAPPDPVSGVDVPHMLREFLVERKRIKDVFIPRGYVPITENLEDNLDPRVTPLVAGAEPNKPLTTSVPSWARTKSDQQHMGAGGRGWGTDGTFPLFISFDGRGPRSPIAIA